VGGKVHQMATIASSTVDVCLAALASMLISKRRPRPSDLIYGSVGIIVADLGTLAGFSRGGGFSFIILAVTLILRRGKRSLVVVVPSLVIAWMIGWVGYTARGDYYPVFTISAKRA